MRRLALALFFVSLSAFAQIPLAMPQFADPPESNGAPYSTFTRHLLWNSGQVCIQRSTPSSWQCLSTAAQTEAARADAVSQANANAAAIYMPTSAANAAIATLNGRVDTVQASAATTSALTSAVAALNTRIDGSATSAALASTASALNTRVDGVQSSVTALGTTTSGLQTNMAALTTRVSTLEANTATSAALAAAVATLNARIDAIPVATPDTVCGSVAISGLSIPLTGISTASTLTVPGAVAGSPCVVGGSSFQALGAYAVCAVTATNTIQVRFQGGGLLAGVIAVPNGTYKACALVRP